MENDFDGLINRLDTVKESVNSKICQQKLSKLKSREKKNEKKGKEYPRIVGPSQEA